MNAEELGKLSIKCRNIAIGLHQRSYGFALTTERFDHISIETDGFIYAVFSEYVHGENEEHAVHISDKELVMDTTEIEEKIFKDAEANAIKKAEDAKKAEEASERKKLYEAKIADEKEYELFLELQKKFSVI